MKITVIITALDEPYINKTIDGIIESDNGSLEEIIVIDDVSKIPIQHSEARVIRNKERKGLIWGRNYATELSKSDIIISIDPHCKITSRRWLSVISERLEKNYNCIAVPKTYCLNPETWEEFNRDKPGFKTIWNWSLDFWWKMPPTRGPYTPAFAGHCFAFTKSWWEYCGGFDTGMNIWGGENIEFALRTWLFGGTVEVVDCFVSHWFKERFQYEMKMSVLLENKARMAESWFDDYKNRFYASVGNQRGTINFGDISHNLRYKARKQQHSFEWFLKRFHPELGLL